MDIKEVAVNAQQVIGEVEKAVVGKRQVLEDIMAAILVPGGHILLEDFPGLAKTLIAKSFAAALGMSFSRIQFTPDLLPGDITGGYIYDRSQNLFILRKGPVFTNLLLADEINRASPKTQSALLEAMQEYQVTLEGETIAISEPFVVIATQNPIEYEGTFPLPEAQLDRFMVKLSIGYPTQEEEKEILRRRRARKQESISLNPVMNAANVLEMRKAIEEVYVDGDVEAYIVELVTRTRQHMSIAVGSSPRGSLALMKLSQAYAAMQSRSFVIPDDVKRFALPALSHRLLTEPDLWTVNRAAEDIVREVLKVTPVPVISEQPK